MFSNILFVAWAKRSVFGFILVGLIFYPAMLSSSAKTAGSQGSKMVLAHNNQIEPIHVSLLGEYDGMEESGSEQAGNLPLAPEIPALRPEEWKSWDVIPSSLSPVALSIYQKGLSMGNNPRAFSKVGDGEISAAWFLTDFDLGTDFFNLGSDTELQTTITYFAGSFGRRSQSARRGFNTQRVLDPTLANPEFCRPGETPLDCEIRLHRPSFALISMGTNQVWQPEEFEKGMREIIETLMDRGVVPILSTKADNLEGDDRINLIIARLTVEYDLPLWNFRRAVEPLPNHGLQGDQEHLTYYPNDFRAPVSMQFAWPVRNLSALRMLERLMEETQQ